MCTAGYVLAGGRSRRMDRDKALLETAGVTLLESIAAELAAVCSPVVVVAPPGRYESLGLATIADLRPGLGPLAGLESALTHSSTEWNLIVACDLPAVERRLLAELRRTALASPAWCVAPEHSGGLLEPLCAAYHRASLPAITRALDDGRLKLLDLLATLPLERFAVPSAAAFRNVNTPADWAVAEGLQ